MKRRQYLATVTTAGAASLLGGCLDDTSFEMGGEDGDDGDGSGDRETVSDRDEGGDSTAEDEIKRAVSQLNQAALSVSAVEEELDDPESSEYDSEEPLEFLSTARDHLETADAAAEGDIQAVVDELIAYADVLEAIVRVAASLAEGSIREDFDDARAAMADRRLEDARSTIGAIEEDAGAYRETLDPGLETLPSLDRDLLEEHDVAEIDSVEDGANRLDAAVSGLETLVAVLGDLVDGYGSVERGDEHFEADEYDAAETEFTDAATHFDGAVTTIDENRDDAPSGFQDYFDTLRCQATNLNEGAESLAEAAVAASERDRERADQHRQDGEAALETAEDC